MLLQFHCSYPKWQDDVRTFFSINTEQLNVTRVEIAMVNFLIEHNLPLATANHATSIFNTVFSDSKIEFVIFSRRERTEGTSGKNRTQPFTLATDGSHDRESDT